MIYHLNWKIKENELVKKFINGAVALNDLFIGVLKGKNPYKKLSYILQNYDLTENQRKYIVDISEKLSIAKEIINHVKGDFKVNSKGYIIEKTRLYEHIFNKPPSNMKFSIKVLPIALAVNRQYVIDTKDLGNLVGSVISLHLPSRDEISRGEYYKHLDDLCYEVHYPQIKSYCTAQEKLSGESIRKNVIRALGCSTLKEYVNKHELKHMLDRFIYDRKRAFPIEVSATLWAADASLMFTGSNIKSHMEHARYTDWFHSMKLVDYCSQELEKLLSQAQDEKTVKEKRVIEMIKHREQIKEECIYDFPFEAFEVLRQEGLSKEALSYIVATTHISKLNHRLILIDKLIQRNIKNMQT